MSDEKINQASADDVRVNAGVSTPEPEVVPKAERRRFSAEYKQRILTEANGCQKAGEIGALLRREGLYRSHLDKWRQQERTLRGLKPQKRGRKPDPQAAEIVRLRRENERLQKRLQQAETIIDVQKTLSAARSDDERERHAAMNHLTEQLAESQGVAAACAALGIPRSSLYRVRASAKEPAVAGCAHPVVRPAPPRALSQAERERVCEILNSERFQDESPREVYATLLDENQYLCSVRTIYRILHERSEVLERRNQLRHPVYRKPELLATGPNQVWSWDITKLRGPSKGIYYYLYVIIDIFSRYVVGWMVAEAETAELAEQLIAETCTKQNVQPAQLTIHADNGGPMTAKVVAVLMADLGVAKSHSRPHVSNDNPYSEAQFKTLKYRPGYPDRFGSLIDARTWSRRFFTWYNEQHHHTGLELLTPAAVHGGQADLMLQQRQAVLEQAFQAHPERFVHGSPQPGKLPEAVWINPPKAIADQSASAPDQPAQPTVTTQADVLPLARLSSTPYTTPGGTEDSATLGSDTSADPVDDVAGQSHDHVTLPASPSASGLHCQQSEKPKRSIPRAPTGSEDSPVAGAPSLYTNFQTQVVSKSLTHSAAPAAPPPRSTPWAACALSAVAPAQTAATPRAALAHTRT